MNLNQGNGANYYVSSRSSIVVLGAVVCLSFAGCQHNRSHSNHGSGGRQIAQTRIVELPAADRSFSNQLDKPLADSLEPSTSAEFDFQQKLVPPVADLSDMFTGITAVEDAALHGDAKSETDDHDRRDTSSEPVRPGTSLEAAQLLAKLGARIDRDYDGAVQGIDLAYLKITDQQAKMLPLMIQLTELDLTGTDISDAALGYISELTTLQSLKLKGTRVTDNGVRHLAKLTQLRILDLGRTEITDASLTHLPGLNELQFLVLNHTQVSDNGIADLKLMQSLRGINLIDSKMTPDGIAQLEKELPRCLVVFQTDDEVSFIHLPAEFSLAAGGSNRSSLPGPDPDIKLRRLQQLAHQDPEIAEHLASVYAEKGEWLKSAAILDVATKCCPQNERLQYRLAESLAYAGRTEEAYLLFRKFLSESAANLAVGVIVYETALKVSESYLERSVFADADNTRARRRLEEIQGKRSLNQTVSWQKNTGSPVPLPTIVPRERPGTPPEMN